MKYRRMLPLILSGGLIGLFGYAIYNANKHDLARTVHTIDGYYIAKKEKDQSTTVYSYQQQKFWKKEQCTLYLGIGNNSLLDDTVYLDIGCDGIVDMIQDNRGATVRAAALIEDWLNLPIGSKKAFERADSTLALYKQRFSDHIKKADKARLVMQGKTG